MGYIDPSELNSIHFGYNNFEKYQILIEIGEKMTKGQLAMDKMLVSSGRKQEKLKEIKDKFE